MGPGGVVIEGRSTKLKPDTNTSFKTAGHINIVVNGRYDKHAKGGDELSSDQSGALKALIKSVQRQYDIPNSKVGAHNDYAQTNCPGENIKSFIRSNFR